MKSLSMLINLSIGLIFFFSINLKALENSANPKVKEYLELSRLLGINWQKLGSKNPPAWLLSRSLDIEESIKWYKWDHYGLLNLIGNRPVWFILPQSQRSFERYSRGDLSEHQLQAQRASLFLDTLVGKLAHDSPSFVLMTRRMTGGHPFLISSFLGVSVEKGYSLAEEISLSLFENPSENKKYVYTLLSSKGDWSGLKFSFFYYKGKVLPLNSWTGLREETFILLHPKDFDSKCDLCQEQIIRSILHEFAISADAKTELPNFEIFKELLVDKTKACQIYNTLANPEVRTAFSTMRAFRVEDKILTELGFVGSKSTLAWKDDRLCSTQIAQIIGLNRPYKNLLTSTIAAIDPPQTEASCLAVPNENLNLDKALKMLDEALVLDDLGQKIPLCQSELIPEFTSPRLKKRFPRGPRPRIGNGSG